MSPKIGLILGKNEKFQCKLTLIFFKIKTNSDFSVFEQIRHIFGISAVVDIIINVTAATATLVLVIQEKNSKMSTSSEMKQLTKDIQYLDT